jgi:four helix bundle protein
MLRIYSTVIEALAMLRPVLAEIEAHDRDLARQLRRASASVALNVSEGSGSRGGTRRERYHNALGSARETGACLDVAEALGYVAGGRCGAPRPTRPRARDAGEERHLSATGARALEWSAGATRFMPRRAIACR